MKEITLIYDGTFEGFLTTLCYTINEGIANPRIVSIERYAPDMFSDDLRIDYQPEHVEDIGGKLRTCLSRQGMRDFYSTFLGECLEREDLLLDFTRKVIATRGRVQENLLDETVRQIARWGKLLYRERHRHEAFIRFHQNKNGEFYALIEPDFDVLPLIIPNFRDRFQDQPWTIYDVRRKYGLEWDLTTLREVQLGVATRREVTRHFAGSHADREEFYQRLWRSYFHSTGIPSRRNIALHIRHMPRRYWKYLVEKHGEPE